MTGSTSGPRPSSLFAADGEEPSDSHSTFHFIILQLSIIEYMECIMLGRLLAPDISRILQVHFYPPHHLLAQVVRQLNIPTFQHPLHRRPLAYRVFQCLLQQLATPCTVRTRPLSRIQALYR